MMKSTKKWQLLVVFLCVCSLAVLPGCGDDGDNVPPPATTDEDPTFLLTIAAVGGVTFPNTKEGDSPPLSLIGAVHVTAFTDRPARQAQSLHANDLVVAWSEAYGDVPPNAELQLFSADGNTQSTVVELTSAPTWDAATQTMTFASACIITTHSGIDELQPAKFFDFGSLFIDGAKLFAWNSCYSGPGEDPAPYPIYGCLEQWGSYAASCLKLADRQYEPGKRCKDVCNTGDCSSGCYSNYDAAGSWEYLASWYSCQ
jgi:hypothetical protein